MTETSEPIGKQLENLRLLPLDAIIPDPNQPRRIDPDNFGIRGLAESIKEHGVMNPIHVIYLEAEDKYQIVNGERRYWASKKAKKKTIPAIILTGKEIKDDSDKAIKQLVDNLQREDLRPFEEAEGYQRLMELYHFEQKDIAHKVGKAKTTISETMSLNKLSEEIKEEVLHAEQDNDIRIPKRFLVNLSRIVDPERQLDLIEQFVKKSVRKSPEKKQGAEGKHLISVAMKYRAQNSQVMVWLPLETPDKAKKKHVIAALEEALKEVKKEK
jgi:ParB family chromosome partitioning protein